MNTGYDLTVIYEENVPLAASVADDYSGVIIGSTLLMMVVFLLFLYIEKCRRYKMRLYLLQSELPIEEQEQVKPTWNLWELRARIQDMELKVASEIISY